MAWLSPVAYLSSSKSRENAFENRQRGEKIFLSYCGLILLDCSIVEY